MSRGWALYWLFQLLRNSKVLLKEKAVNVLPLPHSEWTVALGGLWLNWDLLFGQLVFSTCNSFCFK